MKRYLINNVLAAALIAACASAWAGDSPRLLWGNTGLGGVSGIVDQGVLKANEAEPAPTEKLTTAFETLRGNGSPLGYMLRNGNVVADSVYLTIDGQSLIRNRDYFLDTVTGGISFGRSIKPDQVIRVSYRYIVGKSVARSFAGLPMLPGFSGGAGNSNFIHAYRAADPEGGLPFDLVTFGMRMNYALGSLGMESMYYRSDPRQSSNLVSLLDGKRSNANSAAAVSDSMTSHTIRFGGPDAVFSLGFQDVGANFNGFATLREQGALDPATATELEKQKGLRRMAASLNLKAAPGMPEGSPSNLVAWSQVYNASGAMKSIQVSYATPTAGVVGSVRDVDSGFTRMASLTTNELTDLALTTRKAFEPNATAGQVTDADRAAVTREAGLKRQVVSTYMKLDKDLTGSLSFINIQDPKGDANRQTLSLSSKTWQAWISNQGVAEQFKKLAVLSPSEVSRFGNEYGLRRTEAGFNSAFGGGVSLNLGYSLVGGREGKVQKTSFGVSSAGHSFRAAFQDISPTFTRINDLADAQKQSMVNDRGFRKYDIGLTSQLTKNFKIDLSRARAYNDTELLARIGDVVNLAYAPSDKTKISFSLNDTFNTSQTCDDACSVVMNGTLRRIQSVEHKFNNNWKIGLSSDYNLTRAAGGAVAGTVAQVQHFETDPTKSQWFRYDSRRLDHKTGAFEYSNSFNMQLFSNNRMKLIASNASVDRGTGPSEQSSKLGMKLVATKDLNLGLELVTRQTNYIGDGQGYAISLSGPIASRIGPFSNLILTGEHSAADTSKAVQTYNTGIKFDWMLGKNIFGFDYSRVKLANGQTPMARGFRFKSEADPKKWYELDLSIKDKDSGLGYLQSIQDINAVIRFSPTTNLAYVVKQYSELPTGVLDLSSSKSTKFTTRLFRDLNMVYDYRHDRNMQAKTDILKYTLGLQRVASKNTVLDFGYGLDRSMTPAGAVYGRSLRLKYDRQISRDQYLTFSGEAVRWNNTNVSIPNRDTIECRLDFRFPF